MFRITSFVSKSSFSALFKKSLKPNLNLASTSYYLFSKIKNPDQTISFQQNAASRFSATELNDLYKDYQAKNDKGTLSKEDAAGLLKVIYNLGLQAESSQNINKAEDYYKQGIEIAQKADIQNTDLILLLNNLGNIYYEQEKWENALDLFEKSQALVDKISMENFNHNIEKNILKRAIANKNLGQDEEAKELFSELIEIIEDNPAQELKDIAATPYLELGSLYSKQGDLLNAIGMWELGVETLTKNYGEDIEGLGRIYEELAMNYVNLGTQESAPKVLQYCKKFEAYKEKHGGLELKDLNNIGFLLYLSYQDAEAISFLKRYLELAKDDPKLQGHKSNVNLILTSINFRQKNIEEGRKRFKEAIAQSESFYGRNSDDVLDKYLQILEAFPQDKEIILPYLDEMAKIAEECKGRKDLNEEVHLCFLFWVANLSVINENFKQALKFSEECVRLNGESILPRDYLHSLYYLMSMSYFNEKDWKNSLVYAGKGMKISQEDKSDQMIETYNKLIQSINETQSKQ